MKISRPQSNLEPGKGYGSGIHARPDWLKDWIENKGQYVRLDCGHRLDLKGEITLTTVDGTRQAWCYMHEETVGIGKPIGLFEFHYGFPPPEEPDTPQY